MHFRTIFLRILYTICSNIIKDSGDLQKPHKCHKNVHQFMELYCHADDDVRRINKTT